MFKYISGYIQAKPTSITLTAMLGNAILSWGLGKDSQIDLKQNIIQLKIENKEDSSITFTCTLENNKSFTAQCDFKTYEKLEQVLRGRMALQSNSTSISKTASNPTLSELYAAEKEKIKESRKNQEATAPVETQEKISLGISEREATEAAKIAAKDERRGIRKAQEAAALAELREKENRKKAEKLAVQQAEKDRLAQYDKEGIPYCPKCHSASLSANKKGFGGGKALVGAVVAGPLGLLAGTIGKNNIELTCLKCGHKFKV